MYLQTTLCSLSINASVSSLLWFHFGLNPEPFVFKAGMLAATPCNNMVSPDRFPEVDKLKKNAFADEQHDAGVGLTVFPLADAVNGESS